MKNLQTKTFLFIISLWSMLTFAQQNQKKSFEIKNGHFILNGKDIEIRSGEMHYPRVPKEYWKHRLLMMKAMGLNTVATYVFWNYHEESQGKWDWSGQKDLRAFIKTAEDVGLYVILRPGPYVCAEWEFGGYPWWLQNIKGLKIREDNEPFLSANHKYLSELYHQVKDLQITKGGPIIMVQAENEFGLFAFQRKDISQQSHKSYLNKVVKQIKDVGFDLPMYTSDVSDFFGGGYVEGALPGANGEKNIDKLRKVVNNYHNNQGPYMIAEFYPGWLTHWGEGFPRTKTDGIVRLTKDFLKNGVSFNYYMIHGGTNFGFTSGANYNKEHDIQPDLTSYDYDAPISEAGWRTPKYDSLRLVLSKYTKEKLPDVPAPIKVIKIKDIRLSKLYSVFKYSESQEKVKADKPLTFEELNQGYGYVLYRHHFNESVSGKLDVSGLRDYATVYVNGKKLGELNRFYNNYTMQVDIPKNADLEILVENWGRINYDAQINENTKGIVSPVKIDDKKITGTWEMIKLPFQDQFFSTIKTKPIAKGEYRTLKDVPTIYQGEFELKEAGDTFIDMQNWGKGIIFINGKNLGRFWKVGPQQTLYIPGVWLRQGKNEIIIFDQLNEKVQNTVSTIEKPILNDLTR
ncbi:beta-galactosidase family protein [Chryseobacterium sp. JUb7]|uniref:glycoside hydrolase family 35 protein n=1 Tax=Chryseobacterium sp. JUb7 TaxID=2940599 RepID=UPI0021688132|nr:beta-galactosidase family protein [Chryseobacterium sp. JUb7]MCS3530976.1 beta-galactosidase [Chryseobacterium sp. JUb7]